MRKLVLLLFIPFWSYAQEEFSFELYFEDAIGNKDTLVLGYDPLATDSIDSSFGEVDIINQQWDSIFEVRAGDDYSFWHPSGGMIPAPLYQSKKQIIDKSCDFDYDITININVKHFPFKIYWDTTLFTTDSCRLASILTGTPEEQTDVYEAPEAYLSNRYFGVGTGFTDTVIIDSITANNDLRYYSNNSEEIFVFWLAFANPLNISPNSVGELNHKSLRIYPNPSNQFIIIQDDFPIDQNFLIHNNSGKLVKKGPLLNGQIAVSDLPSGMFYLTIKTNQDIYRSKVIVER